MSTESTIENITIHSLDEYIKNTAGLARGTLFRGVPDIEYELIPSIGRVNATDQIGKALQHEYHMLTEFREKSASYKESSSIIKLAVLAQHHGLPTRLLDWSINPLVALFFAVHSNYDKDSIIYIYHSKNFTFEQYVNYDIYIYSCNAALSDEFRSQTDTNILNNNSKVFLEYHKFILKKNGNGVCYFFPTCVSDRMHAQSSIFTFHPDPFSSLNTGIQATITIPKGIKKSLLTKLEKNGVHEFSMFPGLDGLCQWLRQVFPIN